MFAQGCDDIAGFQTRLQPIKPMRFILGHHIIDRRPRLGSGNCPDVIGFSRSDWRHDFHGAAGDIVKGLQQADPVRDLIAKRKDVPRQSGGYLLPEVCPWTEKDVGMIMRRVHMAINQIWQQMQRGTDPPSDFPDRRFPFCL